MKKKIKKNDRIKVVNHRNTSLLDATGIVADIINFAPNDCVYVVKLDDRQDEYFCFFSADQIKPYRNGFMRVYQRLFKERNK